MRVYEKVDVGEVMRAKGKRPSAVRWVDISKGNSAQSDYRSHHDVVAKEFRGNDDRPKWYAATPPSECLKLVFLKLASNNGHKVLYADVSRAYLYASANPVVPDTIVKSVIPNLQTPPYTCT